LQNKQRASHHYHHHHRRRRRFDRQKSIPIQLSETQNMHKQLYFCTSNLLSKYYLKKKNKTFINSSFFFSFIICYIFLLAIIFVIPILPFTSESQQVASTMTANQSYKIEESSLQFRQWALKIAMIFEKKRIRCGCWARVYFPHTIEASLS
jgi:hypothetical protein